MKLKVVFDKVPGSGTGVVYGDKMTCDEFVLISQSYLILNDDLYYNEHEDTKNKVIYIYKITATFEDGITGKLHTSTGYFDFTVNNVIIDSNGNIK